MESREQREPQGTPQDTEQGTPQDKLVDEGAVADERDDRSEGDVGAPQEGGGDSAADAMREGG